MAPYRHYYCDMPLALAMLLFQFSVSSQNLNLKPSSSTGAVGTLAPETAEVASRAAEPIRAAAEGLIRDSNLPARDFRAAALSLNPKLNSQDRSTQLKLREWLALGFADHGAATFDAWSTRQAISTGQYQEMNPALRPFAGNASLYAAVQVGPLLFDYLGRRMMDSHRAWRRHTWWLPQALSAAVSLGSAVHNLNVR